MTLNDFHISSFVFNNIKNFINNTYRGMPSSHQINTIEDITSITLLATGIIINDWAKVPYNAFY